MEDSTKGAFVSMLVLVISVFVFLTFRTEIFVWLWEDAVREFFCESIKAEYLKIKCGR